MSLGVRDLLVAMWFAPCRNFPRTAFHINVEGVFSISEARVENRVECLYIHPQLPFAVILSRFP